MNLSINATLANRRWLLVLASGLSLVLGASSASATLVLKLSSADYNPSTGVWADSSGQNNHATQATASFRPGLIASQTPTGPPCCALTASMTRWT